MHIDTLPEKASENNTPEKLSYASPERVRIEGACRITAGMGITTCDILGSGKHGGNPDDPDEPDAPA
jgi:hypothetical protein